MVASLLQPFEPDPVAVANPDGRSPVVIVCEHGGRAIPERLGDLGLAREHLAKHFMWDPGALPIAKALSARLDATLIHQRYSRMVCDCNRPSHAESFIPTSGEGIPVPGNANLTAAAREARTAEIWAPFHNTVTRHLDARATRATVLVTIHTFTPVFFGVPRPFHAGILYDRDPAFAPALHRALAERTPGDVRANEPYTIGRDSDVAIPVHGEDRGLPCALVEVRNDLVATTKDAAIWADRLAAAIGAAISSAGIAEETAA